MTVCIAALSENGQICVVGADRQITNPAISLTFEGHERKIETLANHCVAMAAGDSALAAQITERTRRRLATMNHSTVEQIADALKETFMAVHLERADSVILRPRGWTLENFRTHGAQQLPVEIYRAIDERIFQFGLGVVEFIVAGVDPTGGHIFRVHYSGVQGGNWIEWCDKAGSRAIGAGFGLASISLVLSGQHPGLSTAETIYHVYCAKKAAEMAPGVGLASDLAIISGTAIAVLPEPLASRLREIHAAGAQRTAVPQAWRDAWNSRSS